MFKHESKQSGSVCEGQKTGNTSKKIHYDSIFVHYCQILDYHNKLRAALAQGRTRQPGASDMLQLSWDEELAWEAQAHADTCRWGHDCSSCRRLQRWRSVGQNLYQSYRWGDCQTVICNM